MTDVQLKLASPPARLLAREEARAFPVAGLLDDEPVVEMPRPHRALYPHPASLLPVPPALEHREVRLPAAAGPPGRADVEADVPDHDGGPAAHAQQRAPGVAGRVGGVHVEAEPPDAALGPQQQPHLPPDEAPNVIRHLADERPRQCDVAQEAHLPAAPRPQGGGDGGIQVLEAPRRDELSISRRIPWCWYTLKHLDFSAQSRKQVVAGEAGTSKGSTMPGWYQRLGLELLNGSADRSACRFPSPSCPCPRQCAKAN
eukprot:CAMPEP_0179297632 /NCGR_PEP_ID=MMETSP0797-20121207/45568_1 /TAXON_ID=47934 /ORGANISM="Dinophysis acuminata, Strain DAEP01" /LENGTH=256 /DNA_ID=CAMNT_0021006975 /DNA_START=21 /DNA_END=789 /DNA_ORIENTATION=-